jgi:hypothetical protein
MGRIVVSQKRQQLEINRYPHAAQILNRINANVMHKMHAVHYAPAQGLFLKIGKKTPHMFFGMRGVLPQSRAVLRGPSALHRHLQSQFLQGVLQTDQSDSAQVPDHRDAVHVVAEHELDGMGDFITDGDTRRERQLFQVGLDDCVYFAAFHRSIRLRSCSRWKSSHSPSMAVAPGQRSVRPAAITPMPRQNCIAKEMPDACRGRHPLPAGRRKPCRRCVEPA